MNQTQPREKSWILDPTACAISRNRLMRTGIADFGHTTVRIRSRRGTNGYYVEITHRDVKERLGGTLSWNNACDVAIDELRSRYPGTGNGDSDGEVGEDGTSEKSLALSPADTPISSSVPPSLRDGMKRACGTADPSRYGDRGLTKRESDEIWRELNIYERAEYRDTVLEITPRADRTGYDAVLNHCGIRSSVGRRGQTWHQARDLAVMELYRIYGGQGTYPAHPGFEADTQSSSQTIVSSFASEGTAASDAVSSADTSSRLPWEQVLLDCMNVHGGLGSLPERSDYPSWISRCLRSLSKKCRSGKLDRRSIEVFGKSFFELSAEQQFDVMKWGKVIRAYELGILIKTLRERPYKMDFPAPTDEECVSNDASDRPDSEVSSCSSGQEYERVRLALLKYSGHPLMQLGAEHWLTPDDRHAPSVLMSMPLEQIAIRPYDDLLAVQSVGEAKLNKLTEILRRALSAINSEAHEPEHSTTTPTQQKARPMAASPPISIEPLVSLGDEFEQHRERFEFLCEMLRCQPSHVLLTKPLGHWVQATDHHMPAVFLNDTIGELISRRYEDLCRTRGVGSSKIEKLNKLLERACRQVAREPQPQQADTHTDAAADPCVSRPPVNEDKGLTEVSWKSTCELIIAHGLTSQPLGRFARSLSDLPHGEWVTPLSEFTARSLTELQRTKGYGPERIRQIIKVITDLGVFLSGCPTDGRLGILVLPVAIRNLTQWIESILNGEHIPDFDDLRRHFLTPLLDQLRVDLGDGITDMIAKRLGADGDPWTLDQIASESSLTRERIRQITARGPEVLQVRWPEGKHLLDDFYERFHEAPDAHEHVKLVKHALNVLFAITPETSVSRQDVMDAWEAAGHRKLTPMTANEVQVWLAGEFPNLTPSIGLQWIQQDAPSLSADAQRTVYFSNDELDGLLRELYRRNAATALDDLVDVDDREERRLRGKISRDLRIIQNEYKQLLPAEHCCLIRRAGVWHIELTRIERLPNSSITSMPVSALGQLAAAGLLQAGIADATVWGVHRYTNELLERMYASQLPEQVTPFILADLLVCQSDRLFRPMRRRRLRWDTEGCEIPVRGKRGWISHAVNETDVPVTVDELGDLLRQYYQDYASYVLGQLSLDGDEEGEYHCGAVLLPGIPHRVPGILMPAGWSLRSKEDNVSEEVKLAAFRIVIMLRERVLSPSDFDYAPWLLELAQRQTYGEGLSVSAHSSSGRHETTASEPNPHNKSRRKKKLPRLETPAIADDDDVDELLAKFL